MNASKLIAAAVLFAASGAVFSQESGVSSASPNALAGNGSGVVIKASAGLAKSGAAEHSGAPATKHAVNTQEQDTFRAAYRAEMVKLNGGKSEDYSDL